MQVRKRDGSLEPLNIANIRKQTMPATEGLRNVSYEELELYANISFQDGMSSSDIQSILIKSAMSKIDIDAPDWTYVAARLQLYDLYHCIKHTYGVKQRGDVYRAITLADYVNYCNSKNLLSYDTSLFDLDYLNSLINADGDKLFNFLGVDSLINRYLLKNHGEVIELPQHMLMSLSMFASQKEVNPTKQAEEFYQILFEQLKFLPGTPTLANGRKVNGNLFSCYVGSTEDKIESIFDGYKSQGLVSKHGGGLGWDWTRIRALGGIIQNYPNASGGLIPWLKIENDLAIACNQLGVRLGAIAVYVETWHKDIIDFLDLKKNSGDDRRRAKELFLAVSCSDEFMLRVKYNQSWTLFDPYDTPDLPDMHSEEFSSRYQYYEQAHVNKSINFTNEPVVMQAKELWKKIQTLYFETGNPFWFFKDTVNRRHNNKELGIIRSSNLCTEFMNPVSGDNEMAVCNLGSINLAKVHTREQMQEVIPVAMRFLDNMIDLSSYPTKQAESTQKSRRSVGLGVCGEAQLMANLGIHYGTNNHFEKITTVYRRLQEECVSASIQLGAEKGTWSTTSNLRNAYLQCIAPTSSIGILMDTSPMHEPVFAPVWIEDNKLGAFKVTAPNINSDNYEFYKSVYDYNQEDLIRATAIRQAHTDMGISHNVYFKPGQTTGKQVYDAIMLAWELGLGTLYYCRTESPDQLKDNEAKDTSVACFGCAG